MASYELFLDQQPLDLTTRHQDPPSSPLDLSVRNGNINPASTTADEEERSGKNVSPDDASTTKSPVVYIIQQHPSTDDEDSVHHQSSTEILSENGSDALDDPEGSLDASKILYVPDISSASEIPCVPNPSGRDRKEKMVTWTPSSLSNRVKTTKNNRKNYTRVTDNMVKTSAVTTHSFKCCVCGKECFAKAKLNRHLNMHNGVKPFECKHCGISFTQRGNLESHERTHTGERPFICQYCPKAFAQSGTKKHHERTHTGEKPYYCNICWKQFSRKHYLDSHKRFHHTEIRPFICDDCGKSFSRKDTLGTHMRVHTGKNLRKCTDFRRGIRL